MSSELFSSTFPPSWIVDVRTEATHRCLGGPQLPARRQTCRQRPAGNDSPLSAKWCRATSSSVLGQKHCIRPLKLTDFLPGYTTPALWTSMEEHRAKTLSTPSCTPASLKCSRRRVCAHQGMAGASASEPAALCFSTVPPWAPRHRAECTLAAVPHRVRPNVFFAPCTSWRCCWSSVVMSSGLRAYCAETTMPCDPRRAPSPTAWRTQSSRALRGSVPAPVSGPALRRASVLRRVVRYAADVVVTTTPEVGADNGQTFSGRYRTTHVQRLVHEPSLLGTGLRFLSCDT